MACVLKSGGCYTAEYVERLKRGVGANLGRHRFVCLSDVDVPCERVPLETGLQGWYAKLELFRLTGPTLYFDLDTVITGDLSEIAAYPHQFTMLRDFYYPDRPASGVMAWSGDYRYLLDDFTGEHPGHGDQGYIASKIKPAFFQDQFPSHVVSRKQPALRNANERVVCFHGNPRPHDVKWSV